MNGESFFSRILSAMGLKSSYESKHKVAYNLLDYKHLIPASVKSKCGYVSEFGEWIIEPKFKDCGLFADNGLAPVKIDGKWGYIDKSGSYVIEPKFDWAAFFGKNGLAVVSMNGKRGWMDSKCNFVIEPKYDDLQDCENGYAVVTLLDDDGSTRHGIVDDKGKTIIEPMICKKLYGFAKNGLAAIMFDEKFGYIDTDGKMVIEPQFYDIESFGNNGLAIVDHDGMYGLIDKTGKFVVEPKYDLAFNCPNGMVSVFVDGK
ncbi:MAG: WG repeat-containing protein, partial [Bacteroidales bacterium]|nr:WG repeat-containing protein [Bacteroidales bacterium]